MTREEYYGYENGRLGVCLYSPDDFDAAQMALYERGKADGVNNKADSTEIQRAKNILKQFNEQFGELAGVRAAVL